MLNLKQARVVDPILTEVMLGFEQADLVGEALFPVVPVNVRKGKIIRFGKEAFQVEQTERAPGDPVNYITVGYEADDYNVGNDGLGWKVPQETVEEAQEVPHIELITEAMETVIRKMELGEEVRKATLASNAALFPANNVLTATAADMWDNGTSDIFEQVRHGRQVVRSQIGKKPNTLMVGPGVIEALQIHPQIVDRTKYTSDKSITIQILQELLQIERIVEGEGILEDPESGKFLDVWGTSAVFAYVNRAAKSRRVPSFGYTYKLKKSPTAGPARYDADCNSWKGQIYWEQKSFITAPQAGYLFKNIVKPPEAA